MRRLIVGAVAVTALGGGAAAAVAATNEAKQAEQAVLADAAKRLDVSPDQLRSALGAAENAQLDAAVKAGQLTQAQADEIKQRREAHGGVLRLGPGGHGFHRGGPPGWGGRGAMLDDLAKALGIERTELRQRLGDGDSVTEIAKAEGKTLTDVKAAVTRAATERLDADVKAGRITQTQRDELVQHVGDHLEDIGQRPALRGMGGPWRDFDRAGASEGAVDPTGRGAADPTGRGAADQTGREATFPTI